MRLPVTLLFLTPLSCLPELEPGEDLMAMDCNTMPCGEDTGLNQPPSVPQVSIVPPSPTPGDTLECLLTALGYDPEGSSTTYTFGWRRGGQELPNVGQSIVVEGNAGEVYVCWARAADLQGNTGEEGVSSTVTIRDPLAVDDTIQAPADLGIYLEVTSEITALACVFEQASPSHSANNHVTYSYAWEWSQDEGVMWNAMGESTSYLTDSTLTAYPDDLWRCTITSHQDGAVGSSASIVYSP